MNNSTHILILNSDLRAIGYLNLGADAIVSEPLSPAMAEELNAELEKARSPLQAGTAQKDAERGWQYGLTDITLEDPQALQALAETLRRDGVQAYPVPTSLAPAWALLNAMPERTDRENALSHLLYIPANKAPDVVKNIAELQVFQRSPLWQ